MFRCSADRVSKNAVQHGFRGVCGARVHPFVSGFPLAELEEEQRKPLRRSCPNPCLFLFHHTLGVLSGHLSLQSVAFEGPMLSLLPRSADLLALEPAARFLLSPAFSGVTDRTDL